MLNLCSLLPLLFFDGVVLLATVMQVGPDMLISGFLQPLPDIVPQIPSPEETFIVDPTVSPYESSIIFFYKTWDPYGALSNFSPHPIQMPDENGDSVTWLSVEHYYQVLALLYKFYFSFAVFLHCLHI